MSYPYLDFLKRVHEQLQPRAYLEIGVRSGSSLAQARCRSVGIDPAYLLTAELDCSVSLFRTTSDEYFTRPEPLAPTDGQRFDLAFIDGMHLFEYALRDFINTERHCSRRAVVVFDDILPRTVDQAARIRHTLAWTGDVYPLLEVFARYRPDLVVVPVDTAPTGLLLVFGADPENTVLADNYSQIMAEFRRPDPQPVPPELLDRLTVVPPARMLASSVWQTLAEAPDDDSDLDSRVRDIIAGELGIGFLARR